MKFTAMVLLKDGRDTNAEQGHYKVLAYLQGAVWT